MKAKIKGFFNTKEFQPFKIEIEIESIDELKELWHRLNVGSDNLIIKTNSYPVKIHHENTDELWNLIDDILSRIVKE